MMYYDDIHDILQAQIDAGELTLEEATLVDDLFPVTEGITINYTPGNIDNFLPKNMTSEEALDKAQDLSGEYKRLHSQFKKEIKRGEYRSALKTIDKAKQTLVEMKEAISKTKIMQFKTIRSIMNLIAGWKAFDIAQDIYALGKAEARKKKDLQYLKDNPVDDEGCIRDQKDFEDVQKFYAKQQKRAAKSLLKNASLVAGSKILDQTLRRGKNILIRSINRKIASLTKTENKVKAMMKNR